MTFQAQIDAQNGILRMLLRQDMYAKTFFFQYK